MKKRWAVLGAAVLVVSGLCVGCGGSSTSAQKETPAATAATTAEVEKEESVT